MENQYVGAMGYMMLGKQSAKGTAVVPSVGIPLQDGKINTNFTKHQESTLRGNRFATQNVYTGFRAHVGTVNVLMEPNTMGYFVDMLYTKGTTTGSDPYTHPFTVGNTENYYTVEFKNGKYVERFQDVKANSITPTVQDGVYYAGVAMIGLKSFKVVELASTPTGSGPAWTVVFDTDEFDQDPTEGLVVGDTLIFDDGSTLTEADISSITNGTTIEVDADVTSYSSGDEVYLKEQTPTYTLKQPFKWGRTEFRFGANASAALSAAYTEVDEGSTYTLVHSNESDEGARTAGDMDPTDIRRTLADATLVVDKVFQDQTELKEYLYNDKKACVVRMFSEDETYEFRLTLNNIKSVGEPEMTNAGDGIVHLVQNFVVEYDESDAQAFDVKVINGVSSI